MNYIDELAYEIAVEDCGPGLISTSDMELYRIYAVLCLVKGPAVTSRDVHDAWSAWAAGVAPDHRSIVPFDELPANIQAKDDLYRNAIRAVADRHRDELMQRMLDDASEALSQFGAMMRETGLRDA